MKKIFRRENSLFKIDQTQLSEEANKTQVINALYAAVYLEFKGAIDNPKYKNLSVLEKLDKMNEFALNWLKDRGLE